MTGQELHLIEFKYKTLFLKVREMRKAQKEFFATRDREQLKQAKKLEKEVDNLLISEE